MNYYFEDFIEENYRKILQLAKKNYKFIMYEDLDSTDNYIIWRHDIDHSIHRALALAKIEFEEGVKSTYFIHIGSLFYNIFETENKHKIMGILKMGHKLGVHFDPTAYEIKEKADLEKYLKFEKDLLDSLFAVDVNVFSFHNPTNKILKFDDSKIAGMINTYAKIFNTQIGYCSDSNGYWRHDRLEDVIKNKKYKRLQVLTHPEWWQKKVMSPKERVQRCLEGRKNTVETFYKILLEQHGRENIE